MNGEPEYVYEFGRFRLDVVERCLFKDGNFIQLAATVFDILLLLVQNRGRVVTKEELMSTIWAGSFVEENNLTVRMSALRKVLCRDASGRQYVETVRGQGYRFVARVRRVSGTDARPFDAEVRDERRAGEGAAGEPFDSVAVLPFSDDGAESNPGHLADTITGSIINRLSQVPGLKVIAHRTVASFRGQAAPQEVGDALRVRTVLVGRVLQLGERLIVAVELIDCGDGSQIWGGRYNDLAQNLFGFSDEVANDVTATLQLKLTGWKAGYAAGLTPRATEMPSTM